ncbi:hypothetical protein HMI54_005176 [Coelomomyces lativittatus]|nr:hypothetical protein HMI54_005176 [Coelomomyces lativittatus]
MMMVLVSFLFPFFFHSKPNTGRKSSSMGSSSKSFFFFLFCLLNGISQLQWIEGAQLILHTPNAPWILGEEVSIFWNYMENEGDVPHQAKGGLLRLMQCTEKKNLKINKNKKEKGKKMKREQDRETWMDVDNQSFLLSLSLVLFIYRQLKKKKNDIHT